MRTHSATKRAAENPTLKGFTRTLRRRLVPLALLLTVLVLAAEPAFAVPDAQPPREERTGVVYSQGGWWAEIYDPGSNDWIDVQTNDPIVAVLTGNLRTDSLSGPPNYRDQPDNMALNNGVLIATTGQVIFFDPTTNIQTSVDLPPGEPFTGANIADRRGEILAVAHTTNTAYIYNASRDAWVQAPPIPEGVVANLTQVASTGAIVASRERAFVYDVVQNGWIELDAPAGQTIQATALPAMPEPGLTSLVLTEDHAYTYDGGTDTWASHTMPGPIQGFAIAEASPVVASEHAVAVYDPVTNQWMQHSVGQSVQIPRNGMLASRNTAMAVTEDAGYFYSRSRHQWETITAPANQNFTGFAIAENTGVFWTKEGTAYVYDANRQELVEGVAPPNAEIIGGTMNQNLAVVTTDQGAMVYDPGTNQWSHFDVPTSDIPDQPGAPNVSVSRFTTLLNTKSNAWVWNPGSHQFDPVQTDGNIRHTGTSENAAVVATDNGAYVYDPTLNGWSEIKTPSTNEPIVGIDTARNTAVARSEDNAWFYNRSTHQWEQIAAPQNETWNVQMALENTALVCSERHAAVWDPTQDRWVQLEAGGDVSVLRDGNSFTVVTDYKAFVYNRSRHEWQETDMPYDGAAQGGRRQPIDCKPKEKRDKPPDKDAVVKPPPNDADRIEVLGDKPGAPERSVVIVLDASGSMDENNKIEDAKAAAKSLLKSLSGAEVALIIYYDCEALDVHGFTQDLDRFQTIIDGVVASGGTPLYKSIGMAYDLMETKASTDQGDIIVLTDGGESCQDDEDRNRAAATSWSQRRIPWVRRVPKQSAAAPVLAPAAGGLAARPPGGDGTASLSLSAGTLLLPPAAHAQDTGGISLNLVGFKVTIDDEARLQEMTELAGGTYYSADDLAQLTDALKTAAGVATSWTLGASFAALVCALGGIAAIVFMRYRTRRRQPAPAGAPAMGAAGQIRVVRGQATQPVLSLISPVITIGRSSTNTLAVADPNVSRQHVRIRREGGGAVLEDLGSQNGTFVNGQRVFGSQPLYPGDVIQMGSTELVYQAAAALGAAQAMTQPGAAQAAAQPRSVAIPSLAVVRGTSQPPSISLMGRPQVIIGRSASCDIVITGDSNVSRQHAQVRAGPQGYEVTDLGSTNGLFVNGQRLPYALLRPGDRFSVGATEFLFQG